MTTINRFTPKPTTPSSVASTTPVTSRTPSPSTNVPTGPMGGKMSELKSFPEELRAQNPPRSSQGGSSQKGGKTKTKDAQGAAGAKSGRTRSRRNSGRVEPEGPYNFEPEDDHSGLHAMTAKSGDSDGRGDDRNHDDEARHERNLAARNATGHANSGETEQFDSARGISRKNSQRPQTLEQLRRECDVALKEALSAPAGADLGLKFLTLQLNTVKLLTANPDCTDANGIVRLRPNGGLNALREYLVKLFPGPFTKYADLKPSQKLFNQLMPLYFHQQQAPRTREMAQTTESRLTAQVSATGRRAEKSQNYAMALLRKNPDRIMNLDVAELTRGLAAAKISLPALLAHLRKLGQDGFSVDDFVAKYGAHLPAAELAAPEGRRNRDMMIRHLSKLTREANEAAPTSPAAAKSVKSPEDSTPLKSDDAPATPVKPPRSRS